MQKERKKKWTKPMLTVLVRGNPEEGVLQACKGGAGADYGDLNGACTAARCMECYEILAS